MNRYRLLTRNHLGLALALTLGLFVASVAGAGTYTVTLTNGTTFETRYEPVKADWDENIIMINSDRGNWIGLHMDEVADIVSEVEASGFGYQASTTTLFVGWSPNEDPEEEGGEGGGTGTGEGGESNLPDAPGAYSFSLDQFVDVPSAGEGISSQPSRNY